jgi:hypothetical protein
MNFAGFAAHSCAQPEQCSHGGRWNDVMNGSGNNNGTLGIILGGVVAVIAVIFILSGGELGGKKTIEGDQDLPPVSSSGEQ